MAIKKASDNASKISRVVFIKRFPGLVSEIKMGYVFLLFFYSFNFLWYIGYGTESPTMEPTLNPTIYHHNTAFYGFIVPRFILGNVSANVLGSDIPVIHVAIEKGILDTIVNVRNQSITYNDFDVNIVKINDKTSYLPQNGTLYMDANISCGRPSSGIECQYILLAIKENTASFLNIIESELQLKLNDTNLYFTINPDDLAHLLIFTYTIEPLTDPSFWIIIVTSSLFIILCIGLICWRQGKCKCKCCIKNQPNNAGYDNVNARYGSSNLESTSNMDSNTDEQKELL